MKLQTNYFNREWCDWMKLIAAVLVALSHYSTVIVINNHWSDDSILRFMCQGGYIGVAIFFYLSGYGLMESESKRHLSLLEFVKRRLSKVYMPVLMVSLMWIPIYYLFVNKSMDTVSVVQVIYDILWGGKDAVLWFIKILFFMYGVFYLFTYFSFKHKKVLSHVVLVGGLAFTMLISNHVFGDFSIMSIPLFGIGVYTSKYKGTLWCSIPISLWMIILYGTCGLFIYMLTRNNISAHIFVNATVMFVIVVSLFLLNKYTLPYKLTPFLISAIYVLYLVHMKVLDLMVANWGHVSLFNWAVITIIVTNVVNQLRMILKV